MKRTWIDPNHATISVRRQCELLALNRGSYYYKPRGESVENLALMRQIDELYMRYPFYGYRSMTNHLKRDGYLVNEKRIRRLMRLIGLEAIYPKKQTSAANPDHQIYPYLLRKLDIERPNQVWCTDITYIPMRRGFVYLVAIMDWYSRYILSWELSNTLERYFCVTALEKALIQTKPEIFNSDQGAQFTSYDFTKPLLDAKVKISMDGRGRVFDNIFIERFWRTLKYQHIYLHEYETVPELWRGLNWFIPYYNEKRSHQGLDNHTPAEYYYDGITSIPSPS